MEGISMNDNQKNLEEEGTRLLAEKGYQSNGLPKEGHERRRVQFATIDPSRLDSLQPIKGIGGAIFFCRDIPVVEDQAADFNSNICSNAERVLEGD